MIIISVTMIFVFLLGIFVFTSSKLLCILGIALSILVLLLESNLLPVKKISKKNISSISKGVIVLVFILGALTPMNSVEGGINAYEEALEKAMSHLEKDNIEAARIVIDDIKDRFGASDNTIFLETLGFLAEEDYENAKLAVYGYSSQTSYDYYTLLEMVYVAEGTEKNLGQLLNLYLDGASRHPYWTYIQKMAGIALIQNEDFAKAEYHLLRAYEQDPSDYKTAYYLGVTAYEQEHMDDAMIFFQESIERQADEETMGYIAWYTEEIGK